MNTIVVKTLENQNDVSEIWFTKANKQLLDFLETVLTVAIKHGDFRLMAPFLVVRHTMVYAEIYLSDNSPAFPMKQVAKSENIPSGFICELSNEEYRDRWNHAPVSLKQRLFELALEANPEVQVLVEKKYAESELGVGSNPT